MFLAAGCTLGSGDRFDGELVRFTLDEGPVSAAGILPNFELKQDSDVAHRQVLTMSFTDAWIRLVTHTPESSGFVEATEILKQRNERGKSEGLHSVLQANQASWDFLNFGKQSNPNFQATVINDDMVLFAAGFGLTESEFTAFVSSVEIRDLVD
ncbi:MAG: hypothetical protein AAGI68_06890 [Planctomycetota bacterium]